MEFVDEYDPRINYHLINRDVSLLKKKEREIETKERGEEDELERGKKERVKDKRE